MSSDAYTGKLKHIFDRSAKKKPRQADSQPDLPPWDDEDNGGPSSLSAFQQHQVFFDLDSSFVDLSTIRIWLTICDDGHARCTDYAKFGFPPTWLIDVEDECIVSPTQIPGEGRYCALSYVWGQTRTSKLTTATRPAFRRPGAFSADSGVFLPKTIRHAIGLVKALGERYLWVDALCIVQDEGELSELGNMGAIYARAYLTIVAATGWDADEGLWGLRGISRPRHIAENFGDDLQKYIDPDSMIWSSRGWTLQEKEFSRRMIMFCDQTVIWKCLCLCMDESGAELATQSAHGTALAHVNLLLRSEEILPDADPFALFAELTHTIISPYNSRSFTHTSDLPRAFAGIAQALTQTAAPRTPFRQGFCWGLPVAHLPYALTWCAAEENLRPRDRALGFPSWSWMAWEGSVSSE
ncbi:heterokaryon incompatibility protein-domain-containing protein, partial [Podospora conica]